MHQPIARFPKTGTMAAEDHGIEICHPEHGWIPVVVVNAERFAVSTDSEHLWFSLDDPIASAWPLKNAAKFIQWIRRAA